jgi:anti-sigma factor RsiW
MHLDVEQLQRLLDHELRPPEDEAIREHLAQCAACRARVAEEERAEAEFHAQLRQLDHAPPRISAAQIAARARAPGFGRLRWAAAVVLALGLAGAAYAAPGSPLRGWVRAALTWVRGEERGGGNVAGVAVVPGQSLVIAFASRQPSAEVQVILTDGPEVVVRAPLGAATFTSDVERLVIHSSGDARGVVFEIEIPRAAPHVEIQVQEQRRFLKQGPVVTGPYRFAL